MPRVIFLFIAFFLTTSGYADTNIGYGLVQTMHFWEGHDGLLLKHETQQAAENCSRSDFYFLPKSHTHYREMLSLLSSAFVEAKNVRLRLIGCAENFPKIAHVYVSDDQGSAPGPSYTRRQTAFTVGSSSLKTTVAQCLSGETVTGGGYQTTDDPNLNVWEDRPSSNLSGWLVSVSNYGSTSRSGTVHAICVAQ